MNDSDLDRLLRECPAPEPAPDSFPRAVWQRIQSGSRRPAWQFWIEALLRPRIATAGACAALLIGSAAGFGHAEVQRSRTAAKFANSGGAYLQSINPFDRAHLAPHP